MEQQNTHISPTINLSTNALHQHDQSTYLCLSLRLSNGYMLLIVVQLILSASIIGLPLFSSHSSYYDILIFIEISVTFLLALDLLIRYFSENQNSFWKRKCNWVDVIILLLLFSTLWMDAIQPPPFHNSLTRIDGQIIISPQFKNELPDAPQQSVQENQVTLLISQMYKNSLAGHKDLKRSATQNQQAAQENKKNSQEIPQLHNNNSQWIGALLLICRYCSQLYRILVLVKTTKQIREQRMYTGMISLSDTSNQINIMSNTLQVCSASNQASSDDK